MLFDGLVGELMTQFRLLFQNFDKFFVANPLRKVTEYLITSPRCNWCNTLKGLVLAGSSYSPACSGLASIQCA